MLIVTSVPFLYCWQSYSEKLTSPIIAIVSVLYPERLLPLSYPDYHMITLDPACRCSPVRIGIIYRTDLSIYTCIWHECVTSILFSHHGFYVFLPSSPHLAITSVIYVGVTTLGPHRRSMPHSPLRKFYHSVLVLVKC